MSQPDGAEQFAREVFPAELAEINKRRRQLGLPEVPADAAPSAKLGLVGLAISGGGIRSATFALGVVQALTEHGLRKIGVRSLIAHPGSPRFDRPRKAERDSGSATCQEPRNRPAARAFAGRYRRRGGWWNGGSPYPASVLRETTGMANYRRWRVPGGTYFSTINLLEQRSDLLVQYIDALRQAVRRTLRERPCYSDGWVVLPEPMHCIITLPEGDDDSRAGRGRYPVPNVFRLCRTA